MKYRKKPVVVEAVRWDGSNLDELCRMDGFRSVCRLEPDGLYIHTMEGDHFAAVGDMVIQGVHGEFYPCKPDIFAKTYEEA